MQIERLVGFLEEKNKGAVVPFQGSVGMKYLFLHDLDVLDVITVFYKIHASLTFCKYQNIKVNDVQIYVKY